MSTIHIKVHHEEEKKLFVKDLSIADIFTLKEDDNQIIYLMMPVTGGYRRVQVCPVLLLILLKLVRSLVRLKLS